MSPGPALSTLATKDGGANDGGRKPDQPATLPLDSKGTMTMRTIEDIAQLWADRIDTIRTQPYQ